MLYAQFSDKPSTFTLEVAASENLPSQLPTADSVMVLA